MDHLEDIIRTLDKEECAEFALFIQRNRVKKKRKDLLLFERYVALQRRLTTAEVMELGFPSLNAYHSTRKRLYAHLSDFALLKSQSEDQSAAARVDGMINIAAHLFQRGLLPLAWTMIDKASALAEKNRLYAQLSRVYMMQAAHASSRPSLDVADLKRRHMANNVLLQREESLIMKKAEITQRIARARQSGQVLDVVEIFRASMMGTEDRSFITSSPRALCMILRTIREQVIHSKEYAGFGRMVASLYTGAQAELHPIHAVELLYMMAHAEYRNKDFATAARHLRMMSDQLAECSRSDRAAWLPRYRILLAANGVFTDGLSESIESLRLLLSEKVDARLRSNITVNLSTYLFFSEDYATAKRTMATLSHSDKWYADRLGEEWCFKQRLIELLIFHESGDVDLFESRLRSFDRRFKTFLKAASMEKGAAFVRLLKKYHHRFDELSLDELEQNLLLSWEWIPAAEEDLQAMMFYAWIKSKVVGRKCHQVLMQLVSGSASAQPKTVY